MTKILEGGIILLEAEEPDACEECGTVAETRPYGPGGSRVCIDCGDADPRGVMAEIMKAMGIPTSEDQLDQMMEMMGSSIKP